MPELGKATYVLTINSTEFDAGLAAAEGKATATTDKIAGQLGLLDEGWGTVGASAERAATETGVATDKMAADAAKAATANEAAAVKSSASWEATNKKMEKLGNTLTHKLTLPVAALFGGGAFEFLKFSQSTRQLQTEAGATAAEVGKMRTGILNLAKGTTQGPNQLATAMFRVQSDIHTLNGRVATTAQKLAILKQASNGAMIGVANLDDATYALVSTMNTGIKGTGTAAKTMASLNAIVGQGDMHLQDLLGALSTGLAAASRTAGVSLNDIGAAVATLTSRSIPATKAATWLGTTLTMLQRPTGEMQKAMAQLGMGSLDLSRILRTKGLGPALEYLKEHLEKIKDPAKRAELELQAIGGQRSGKAIQILVQSLGDYNDRLNKVNAGMAHYNDEVKAARAEPINQLRIAWSNVQVALVQIGATITPIFVKIGDGIAWLATEFGKLPPFVKDFGLAFLGASALIGPGLKLTASLLGGVRMAVNGVRTAMIVMGIAGEGALTGIKGALISTGIGAALLALGLAAAYVITHWSQVKGWFETFWKYLKAGALAAKAALLGAFYLAAYGIMEYMTFALTKVLDLMSHIPFIGHKFKAAANDINNFVNGLKDKGLREMGQIGTAWGNALGNNFSKSFALSAQQVTHGLGGAPGTAGHSRRRKVKSTATTPGLGPGMPTITKSEFLPLPLQNALLEAEIQGSPAAQAQALKEQLQYLQRYRETHKMSPTTLNNFLQELASVSQSYRSQLSTMVRKKTSAAKKKESAKKRAEAKKLAAERREEAKNPFGLAYTKLQVAELRAKTKGNLAQDEKYLKAEENYLNNLLKNRKLSADRKRQILKQLATVENALHSDIKKAQAARDAELKEVQSFLDLRGSFFSQFGSSVFHATPSGLAMGAAVGSGKTLTYHQENNYNEIPKDRFALARQMRDAASAVMGGF